NADVTAPVYAYSPNDYGLYNMAGNVSEWVMDVYRPLSSEDMDEFRPFRGNVFQTKVLTSDGAIDDKLDDVVYDVQGDFDYLQKFQKITENKLNADEQQLLDNLMTYSEEAVNLKNEGKDAEASLRVKDGVQLIRT